MVCNVQIQDSWFLQDFTQACNNGRGLACGLSFSFATSYSVLNDEWPPIHTYVNQPTCSDSIHMSENGHSLVIHQGSTGGPKKDGTRKEVHTDYGGSMEAFGEFRGLRCLEGSQEQKWWTFNVSNWLSWILFLRIPVFLVEDLVAREKAIAIS